MVITHDHWDHLDYETIKSIRNRVKHVIIGLEVGEHLEFWKIPQEKITEMDWYEHLQINDEIKFTALPVRHFSGRGISPKKHFGLPLC